MGKRTSCAKTDKTLRDSNANVAKDERPMVSLPELRLG